MAMEYEVPPPFPAPPEFPPPQEGNKANADNKIAIVNVRRDPATLRNKIPSGNINNIGQEFKVDMRVIPDDLEEDAPAVSVSMDVALKLAITLTEGGLNEQEMLVLLGWQPKATAPLKPFTEDTVTLKLAEPPGFTVALLGDIEPLKSRTCSVADVLRVTGLLVPITVSAVVCWLIVLDIQ
jgi:hypothetical protein